MTQSTSNSIFLATVFKSGTKLLEFLLTQLTGMQSYEPPRSATPDYESADSIQFPQGCFFTWHNVPSPEVKQKIIQSQARPIFLVRNIYDLLVSQYYHFASDIDAEIGRSANTKAYFESMSLNEGLSLVICGATSEQFDWTGYGFYLRQIQEMLKFSTEHPCLIINYERLVLNKVTEILRISEFLEITNSDDQIAELVQASSLENMRNARAKEYGTGMHFRKGSPGDHTNVLAPFHYDMISHIKRACAPDLDDLCRSLCYEDIIETVKNIPCGQEICDSVNAKDNE